MYVNRTICFALHVIQYLESSYLNWKFTFSSAVIIVCLSNVDTLSVYNLPGRHEIHAKTIQKERQVERMDVIVIRRQMPAIVK